VKTVVLKIFFNSSLNLYTVKLSVHGVKVNYQLKMGRIIKEPIIEEPYSCKNLPLPTGRQANPSFPKRGNSSLYEREEYPPPL
jgi:hypothetical protein